MTGVADPPLLVTGLLAPDPAFELYRVRPGGATVVELSGDDEVRVVDRHGGQVAELTAIGAPLGPAADADASVIRRGGPLAAALASRGLDVGEARCARLFGVESAPGSEVTLTAVGDTTLVVGAPGGRLVDGDMPASELQLLVRRSEPAPRERFELPPPLAEPRLDLRIDAATAHSYEVRAGEYIQVIDVQGKQCSDFLAFGRAKLERGAERGLDATVTPHADGQRLPAARPVRQVLRPRHGPPGGGRAGHRRAPRHVRASPVRRSTTRISATPARQLHRQLQPDA